jgi:hypothetical protein
VARFNFPIVKQKDVIPGDSSQSLMPDQILARMIEAAKVSVTGNVEIIQQSKEGGSRSGREKEAP